MSNDLVVRARNSGGLAAMMQYSLDDIAAATEQVMQETGTTSGSFLQYSGKTGEYKLNGKTVEHGTQFIFGFMQMRKGVICWRDNKPIKRETVFAMSREPMPSPPPEDQRIRGDKWNDLMELPVRCLDDGLQVEFGLSTKTGVSALSRLFQEWGQKARMHVEADGKTPKACIVEVSSKRISFKDKDKPEETIFTFVPVFKIVEFVSHEEFNFADAVDENVDPAEEAETEDAVVEVEGEAIEDAEVVEEAPPPPPQKAASVRRPAPAAAPTRPTTTLVKPTAPARPATGFGAGVRGKRA
jgi:hypothetical protein